MTAASIDSTEVLSAANPLEILSHAPVALQSKSSKEPPDFSSNSSMFAQTHNLSHVTPVNIGKHLLKSCSTGFAFVDLGAHRGDTLDHWFSMTFDHGSDLVRLLGAGPVDRFAFCYYALEPTEYWAPMLKRKAAYWKSRAQQTSCGQPTPHKDPCYATLQVFTKTGAGATTGAMIFYSVVDKDKRAISGKGFTTRKERLPALRNIAARVGGNVRETTVAIVSLKFFLWKLQEISVPSITKVILKMDIEGAEHDTLDAFLREGGCKYVDILLVEWHGKQMGNIHRYAATQNRLEAELSSRQCGIRYFSYGTEKSKVDMKEDMHNETRDSQKNPRSSRAS